MIGARDRGGTGGNAIGTRGRSARCAGCCRCTSRPEEDEQRVRGRCGKEARHTDRCARGLLARLGHVPLAGSVGTLRAALRVTRPHPEVQRSRRSVVGEAHRGVRSTTAEHRAPQRMRRLGGDPTHLPCHPDLVHPPILGGGGRRSRSVLAGNVRAGACVGVGSGSLVPVAARHGASGGDDTRLPHVARPGGLGSTSPALASSDPATSRSETARSSSSRATRRSWRARGPQRSSRSRPGGPRPGSGRGGRRTQSGTAETARRSGGRPDPRR